MAKMSVLFLMISLHAFAEQGILYERSSGIFGSKTTFKAPANANVNLFIDTNDGIISLGGAAHNLTSNNHPGLAPQIQWPSHIEIRSQGVLIAGMFEVLPDSGIFVGSRHSLQAIPASDIESSFQKKGFNLAQFHFYEVRYRDQLQDIVFAIPISAEPYALKQLGGTTFQLVRFFENAESVKLGDRFASAQLGTTGKKTELEQMSTGFIGLVSNDGFYLSPGQFNFTTLRSSGSFVYSAAASTERWLLAGIVECVIEKRFTASGVAVPGSVRVLPFSRVFTSELSLITLENISQEKPATKDGVCVPIDIRAGGGP